MTWTVLQPRTVAAHANVQAPLYSIMLLDETVCSEDNEMCVSAVDPVCMDCHSSHSVDFISHHCLQGYSLGFAHYSETWLGCQGTLMKGGHCWGCVWEMDAEDFEELNRSEYSDHTSWISRSPSSCD